jgi:hypothetical protein
MVVLYQLYQNILRKFRRLQALHVAHINLIQNDIIIEAVITPGKVRHKKISGPVAYKKEISNVIKCYPEA